MSLNCIQGRNLFVQWRSHPSLHWQGDQCDHLDDDNQFDDLDESNTVLFEYWLMVMILLKIMHIYANHLPEVQLKEWWRWRWWKWWHFKCHNIIKIMTFIISRSAMARVIVPWRRLHLVAKMKRTVTKEVEVDRYGDTILLMHRTVLKRFCAIKLVLLHRTLK